MHFFHHTLYDHITFIHFLTFPSDLLRWLFGIYYFVSVSSVLFFVTVVMWSSILPW